MRDFESWWSSEATVVDKALDCWLPSADEPPQNLHRALRYSVFAGGKRLRPLLVREACRASGGDPQLALPTACAVELIHTYSLIHDDLPCMDDADLRRGQPTSHRVFGEAMAVLAGDALLTLAFELMARVQVSQGATPLQGVEVMALVSEAVGATGMIGGQVMDLESGGQELGADRLGELHARKTGALFRACAESGAVLAGASFGQRSSLRNFGQCLGLAFQIADDLLDVMGDPRETGKDTAGDAKHGKLTFVSVYGEELAWRKAHEAKEEALACLREFDQTADRLREITHFAVERRG